MKIGVGRIKTYDRCPLRFRWAYMDTTREELEERDTYAGFQWGRAVHAVLEDVYGWMKHTVYQGPAHAPQVLAQADEALDRHFDPDDNVELAQRRDDARDLVYDYLMEQHNVTGEDIIGCEMYMRHTTANGHVSHMFLDRIDRTRGTNQGLRIVDYKAVTRNDVDPEEEARQSMQGQAYSVAAASRFPWASTVEFRLEFLGSRNHSTVTRDREELAWTRRELDKHFDQAAVKMARPPYNPNTGRWCNHCPFDDICPAYNDNPDPVPAGMWDPIVGEVATAQPDTPTLFG